MGQGGYALVIFLSFISVLIEGIAYCWRKGDLDWVKSFQVSLKEQNKKAVKL
jgi:NADH-quinone oxidoreductase subunit A